MKTTFTSHAGKIKSTAAVLFAAEGESKDDFFPDALANIKESFELGAFKGKSGEFAYVPLKSISLLIVGIGKSATPETIRRAAASAVRSAVKHEVPSLTVFVPEIKDMPKDTARI